MKQIRERWQELDRECSEIEQRLGAVARRAIRNVTNKQEARRIVDAIFGPVDCFEKHLINNEKR